LQRLENKGETVVQREDGMLFVVYRDDDRQYRHGLY
jgi:hypothetical protein